MLLIHRVTIFHEENGSKEACIYAVLNSDTILFFLFVMACFIIFILNLCSYKWKIIFHWSGS